jgi:hypothetical protein
MERMIEVTFTENELKDEMSISPLKRFSPIHHLHEFEPSNLNIQRGLLDFI